MDRSAVLATKIRAAFAPCSLAEWPTPLEEEPSLARALGLRALWLKREDKSGGKGSSHCLATARSAKALGYQTAVATFPQPDTDASRAVAASTAVTATLVVRASSLVTLPWAVLRAWREAHHLGLGTPHWIPGGGADP